MHGPAPALGHRSTLRALGAAVLASLTFGAATAAADTASFTTPGTHAFTVPAGVVQITISATGGGGGSGSHGCVTTAGKGGSAQATVPVTAGAQMAIVVAGQGADGTAQAGGAGGAGGGGDSAGPGLTTGLASGGGGGGGASSVTPSGSGPLLVAAGGGGCGGFGGGGGGDDEAAGGHGSSATGGGAGTQMSGGAGGTSAPAGVDGQDGTSGQGGAGAGGDSTQNGSGGGGGGGYFGGGGGGGVGAGFGSAGGGGGGSDFADPSASAVTITNGVNAGDGQVTLTYTVEPPPTATTGAAGAVATTSATLNGTVNPQGVATTYHFEYGTSTSYGASTAALGAGSDSADHVETASLTGLTAGTTYHFRIVASNAGRTVNGADQVFTTGSPPVASAPGATTAPAVVAGPHAATVKGSVDPRGTGTTYHFDYGPGAGYGASTAERSAGAGNGPIPVSEGLANLAPGTTYHVRLVATSSAGTTSGGDVTFATAAPPAITGLAADHRCVRSAVLTTPRDGAGGLSFAFTLSADATVHYEILRRVGSPHWKACPPTGGATPTTFGSVWQTDVQQSAGPHDTGLATTAAHQRRTVRLGRGRRHLTLAAIAAGQHLRWGTYLLRLTATNANGVSAPVVVKFWVLGGS